MVDKPLQQHNIDVRFDKISYVVISDCILLYDYACSLYAYINEGMINDYTISYTCT